MKKYILRLLCILIITVVACNTFPIFGVPKNNIESHARQSQQIDDRWQVSKCVTDDAPSSPLFIHLRIKNAKE